MSLLEEPWRTALSCLDGRAAAVTVAMVAVLTPAIVLMLAVALMLAIAIKTTVVMVMQH